MSRYSDRSGDTGNKNDWCTPKYLFKWLDKEFHFTLDAAASDEHHVCNDYYTIETDALKHDWIKSDGTPHVVFCNPPYGKWPGSNTSMQAGFWKHALAQAKKYGVTTVLLVPARTETYYWHDYGPFAKEIRLLLTRIQFDKPEGGKGSGNDAGSVLVVFGPINDLERGECPRLKFVNPPYDPRRKDY